MIFVTYFAFPQRAIENHIFTGSDRDYFRINSPKRDVAEDGYFKILVHTRCYKLRHNLKFLLTIVERRKNSIQILFLYLLWHIDVLQSLTDRSCAHALVCIG